MKPIVIKTDADRDNWNALIENLLRMVDSHGQALCLALTRLHGDILTSTSREMSEQAVQKYHEKCHLENQKFAANNQEVIDDFDEFGTP
jgi:hypothetical protein